MIKACTLSSKSVGNKVYDKNKKLLGKIREIRVNIEKGAYLDIEVEGCSPDERCLLHIKRIRDCGDFGYIVDIERDALVCRRKKEK